MGGERHRNLDALRGVCALTVALYHCTDLAAPGRIFCHGYLAVDVFFILSGFVIAASYEQRLAAGLGVTIFLRRRLLRLAPVYWAGTLLAAAAFAAAGHGLWPLARQTLMALVLAPELAGGSYAYPVNFVAWSLAGEMTVNLLYACGLFRLSTRALAVLAGAGWGLALGTALSLPGGWNFGPWASDFLLAPLRAVPGFLAGVILFRLHRAGGLARLPDLPPLLVLLCWVLIAAVPAFGPTPLFDFAMVALGGPAMIALLVRGRSGAPAPLLWLGAISYPLYASHRALIVLAHETGLLGRGMFPARALLICLAAVAVAALIHRLVEQRPGLMRQPRLA